MNPAFRITTFRPTQTRLKRFDHRSDKNRNILESDNRNYQNLQGVANDTFEIIFSFLRFSKYHSFLIVNREEPSPERFVRPATRFQDLLSILRRSLYRFIHEYLGLSGATIKLEAGCNSNLSRYRGTKKSSRGEQEKGRKRENKEKFKLEPRHSSKRRRGTCEKRWCCRKLPISSIV